MARLKPDMVISSGEAYHFVNRIQGSSEFTSNVVTWTTATERTLHAIKAAADAPLFLIGAPPGGRNFQDCYAPRSTPASCVAQVRPVWLTMSKNERAAASSADAVYIDPSAWLCAEGWCSAAIADIPACWDGVHLTRQMSERLGPELATALGG